MLNIPLKGDGTIDSDERAFLEAIATWIPKHGEAIYGTRPFTVFGEGPPDVANNANFNERNQRPYTVRRHPLHHARATPSTPSPLSGPPTASSSSKPSPAAPPSSPSRSSA